MAEDFGMFGLPAREVIKDPNATRTPVVGSVPVPGITVPKAANFKSEEEGLGALAKTLSSIGVDVSSWADKEALKEKLTGQMMYQQGKTAQEVMTQEGHFAQSGWHAMNAETQATQWMQQALLDIADTDKSLNPVDYRKKLQTQVTEMTNAMADAPAEALELLTTQTAKVFPALVGEHLKAHAKYNDEKTGEAFSTLGITKATDPRTSDMELATILNSEYGKSEKGLKAIVQMGSALASMGPAGVDGHAKFMKALGVVDTAQYGYRADGTPKGPGFLGPLKRKDGKISTELSIGVKIDGKETEIPTLVPTLTKTEVESLLAGDKPSQDIVDKAVAFAQTRIKEGKSPFAEGTGPLSQSTILERHFEQESGRKQIGGKGSVKGPNEPTTSPAGAIGYSQIMPEHAKWIAEKVGMKWDIQKFYWNQDYNKALGEKYYGYLLTMFNGDPEKAIAAYNRGPNALKGILSKYTDVNAEGWKEDPDLSAETKKHLKVVFGDSLGGLQTRGFTPAQLEELGSANKRAQAERSARFTTERTQFELGILKTIDDGKGLLNAQEVIQQYQKDRGLSDQWANSVFDAAQTRQNKYDDIERVRQTVLGALSNNTVADQPARERELAFDLVQQSLIGQAQANEMNSEQTKEFVRSRMADFIVANQGVVDTRIQNRIQGGPLQDPVGKDGKINQGVLEAYKDYIALLDKGGPQVADAYAGKAADFYQDVRTYDTGTNTQEALIAASKKYTEENKAKYRVPVEEVQDAVNSVINNTSPDRWYYYGDQRTSGEVESLKSSPSFIDAVTRLAELDLALTDSRDPHASALKAARAASERGEFILGSFVLASHGSNIKQDMGINTAKPGAAEQAVLLALQTQGPKVYGDKWQTAIDRDARVALTLLPDVLVNRETRLRAVPEGTLQYLPKSKEFLFYPKIPSWFNPLGEPTYGEKAVVIKAEDAGKAYQEYEINSRSAIYKAVEAIIP